MPSLEAYRESRSHRHVYSPLDGQPEYEVCTCGAMRRAQQPETD